MTSVSHKQSASTFALTTGLPLPVEQDAIHGGPDENISAPLLDDRDHVKGKLAGTAARIVRAALVVVKEQRVDEEAGLLWRDALKKEKKMSCDEEMQHCETKQGRRVCLSP